VISQDFFAVVAPILRERKSDLFDLLATMNKLPGMADPTNGTVPFGEFHDLHFARFSVLDDHTVSDLAFYGESFPNAPVYLVFLGDCDGPSDRMLQDLARRAEAGLRRIFAHCESYDPSAALLPWMKRHLVGSAASYVNFVGRTVRQIRYDAALHDALIGYLGETAPSGSPREIHERLACAVRERGPAPKAEEPGSVLWELEQWLRHAAAGAVLVVGGVCLLTTPLIVLIPLFLFRLRQLERSDPVIVPRPSDERVRTLGAIEDYDLVNQFSALGSAKPGLFRKATMTVLLYFLNFANWALYSRGHLARIGTIHFAHWIAIDDRRRLFFVSNYDRSLATYADDFVNKVAFGINLVFSNGIGFPRTRFLILDGAKNERNYQLFLRRHQIPTQVWYNAYPGLTVFDVNRNALIREGLEKATMTNAQIRQWLMLI
jgi:hypothetical protein